MLRTESGGKTCFRDRGLEPYSQRMDVLLWPLGVTTEVELTLVPFLLTALEVGNGKPEANRSMRANQQAKALVGRVGGEGGDLCYGVEIGVIPAFDFVIYLP